MTSGQLDRLLEAERVHELVGRILDLDEGRQVEHSAPMRSTVTFGEAVRVEG